MEGDGMVAVVRGLREAGLAVTLLDGNRQYTLLPNTTTQPQPAPTPQRAAPVINVMNASTQQCPPKFTTENSTEPVSHLSQLSAHQCERDAQAVDGRYASMYKTMHCNIRPTSPPVQLAEFPPQRPELYPGHGNFIVGGAGSGVNGSQIRASSPVNSFRGGMCWPDRGSVCSPRPSRVVDEFARSLRKYPNCLSPDRSSEVMERLVNYTQANKVSRTFRNSPSPTRISEQTSQHVLETKATFNKATRSRTYEPDVTIRPKKTEEAPTRDRKKDEHHDRPVRGYEVRCLRDMSKRMREGVKAYMSYPYSHPVCPPTIRENQDYHPLSCHQNSSNSVNMEIQAAVKMLSKEVATLPRGEITRKTVAVPESPVSSAGEEYVEGEFYFVENLDIRTSIKSIQTNFYPSDTTLKPKKSAQTVFSTIDFHSSRNRTIVSRKTKSQEEIKLSKDELKISLLQLINEISDTVSKNTIRDELIKKLFVSDNCERNDHEYERRKSKNDKCHKYGSGFSPTVCDYVGDYQELVGKLKHCYGDSKHVLRSEIKPFRLSEYRQLDFVLKDWVSHLNLKTSDVGRCVDRSELLHTVEDRIKDLLKNWTKEDFDLKSEIVDILEEIPIEVNKSYGIKSYLRKLVDVLLKRMRNVIVTQQSGRIRRRSFASRSRKILTEEDMRDYVRAHLLDFLSECNLRICNDTLDDLENELVDLMMDSIDCIWCGHDDEIIEEMNMILQDLGKMTDKQANCISNIMIEDLQDMLNNCVFNQTYTILNVSNNSGPYMNSTDNTDFSIGSINEEDLDSNLDRYTNQLCLQINQWLDTLNIPRIQDSGFREVVVNDLAGDIVDRHKYLELNHTGKDSAQDQLEALKYQIFKWINKLVGDENQETISHAENLLQRINNVPVPMLVNPKHRSGGPCCEMDSICTNSGQGSPKPYSPPPQVLSQSKPCCEEDICPNTVNDGQEAKQSGRCCAMKICLNGGQATSIPQRIQPHTGFLPHTDQTGGGFYGHGPQTADAYCPPQGRSSPNSRGSGLCIDPAFPCNLWGSNTFLPEYDPCLAGNCTQTQHGNASAGRMGTSGRTYGPMVDPYQQSMRDPNPQAMSGCCTESSPTRHGGSVPVKKLNEDYDEYLKEWVKKLPIAGKTAAEEQKAETARLGVYNGIWKSVTKMKLDPNIFGNQYYCQDVFEEEMERLLVVVPQSPELEAAKPTLKAELLQKTLAMNDLIKSTNAPASFKQQLIDNIENNLPERTPTENEADKQNYLLDKQNMADYYILYTRYKGEDNVKATVHQKNFLKKLDEFLNKIKNRHNISDMDTTAYANEIINSFDKIPTPNLPAIKDEADDILLAMEVENWISDIPQKPETAGPLEKRRTRDAIVKKIQEIATDASCCDNAFRIPLKAELPRYLEKIPMQEGTNVDYMIDELANRIKNLSTSIRRVSFQDPQNYEEFSRNMPAASSMHEMSDERSSYLIVGGDVVNDSGPRRSACVMEQTAVPQGEIEWFSMEQTQMPSQMRSGYVQGPQRAQSAQCCNPNASNIPSAQSPQVYNPNASYRGEGNIPRDADANRTWSSDKAAVPNKRQKLSMQESRTSPNMRNRSKRPESMSSQLYNPNESLTARGCPGQGNFVADAGLKRANWGQTPVPEEEIQWHSMEETQMPSQMRSASISPQNMRSSQVCCPNTSEQMAFPRSYPRGAQQVQGQYPPNAQTSFVPNSQGPFSPNVGQFTSYTQGQLPSIAQGQFPSNLQGRQLCTGPPCCPNPLCNIRTQSSPGSGSYQHTTAHSPCSIGPYGPGYPNVESSPNAQVARCCKVPNVAQISPTPQRFSGPGSPDRYNQSFGPIPLNIKNTSAPESQIHPQGPHAPRQSQDPQASNVQGASCCSVPNNQDQSFGPGQPAYNQVAPGVPGGQPYPRMEYPTSPNVGKGRAFNNNRQSFGPRFGQGSLGPGGQMHGQGSLEPGGQMHCQGSLGLGGKMHDQGGLGTGEQMHGQGRLGPAGQMHGQGNLESGGQTHCQESLGPGGQMHGQGSLGPGGQMHGQGNLESGGQTHCQGSLGPGGQMHGQGSLGPAGQMHGQGNLESGGQTHCQGSLGPGGQMHGQDSLGPRGQMHDQESLGPGGQMHGQGSLGSGGQMHGQESLVTGGQMHGQGSLVPRAQMHGQGSLEPGGQTHCQGTLGPGGKMHDQGSLGPGGQIPFVGPNGSQMGQVGQDSCCTKPNVPGSPQHTSQPSTYGVIEGSSQGYLAAHHNASGQAQASRHSATLNQTSQSPGPVSAASQVPDHAPKPYKIQKRASGGVGVLCTSQVPDPSSRSVSVPGGSAPSCCSGSGAQAVGTDAISAIHISTDNTRVQQTPDQNQESQPTYNKLGTVSSCYLTQKELEENPPEESKNEKIKPLDVNEKEVFNFKSVQTAFSTIDITTTKCKYCEIRSKSQEELTRKTKKQEVIKITDPGPKDLQQEVTEWFEIHSDKVKVKLWGEKMKKLAEKLKKPGGEEKLRNKIEKYLKQAPEQHTEADDDNLEFRKQLPNDIIRKLKQMYLCPTDANLSIYRMEIPKYCSRYKIDNFRKAVQTWTKTLNIKKKDFLGRNVKKDDVFKYVSDKLEPLVLDRPQSDSEYKEALQSSISEIVYELPLALSSHNKDFYLNKVTENLVDNIFMMGRKFSSTYIQPTTKEIKEFVKDEITFFLEKCRVTISTKRMEYLEAKLVDLLLDLTDIADIDNYVADDVTKLLKEVVKLPEYKAKYFTNLLLKNYKEFFFRENFFHLKGNSELGRPDVYSAFHNATRLVDFNSATTFDTYRQRLVEKINKWITKLDIPVNDKNFIEVIVKDLATDIVDRYKYLLLNPNLTGTDAEELEQLKFQIFKWTNKLVGEENTSVLEHAQELMNEINSIPKPSFQSTSFVQSTDISPLNNDKINNNNTKSYIDILTDHIYNWYCELPIYLHTSQDARHNKLLIKELAREIEKGLEKKEDRVIDNEVGKWIRKVFNNELSNHYVQELKKRISNVPYTKDNRANNLKHEKVLIRTYEDIVDEWIDAIPMAPNKQELFTNNKNEIVHSLAVKIHKITTKINHLPVEVVEKKLQEEISHWLKKLPLYVKVDNQNDRDKYAAKLLKSIQKHNIKDLLENQPVVTNEEPLVNQLEKVLLEWLKKLPLYREKSPEKKEHQETTIKGLAHKLNQTIGEKDADEDIIEQVRMLDLKQKDYFVKNTAFQLKTHLQKLDVYKDLCKQREQENQFLVETVEVWLKGLPLQITDASRFNKQKTDFIKGVKRLISAGTDNAVMKKEILIFTRSLPISHKKKYDFRYLNEEVFKLIQKLEMQPIDDVSGQSPPSNTITDHHHNSNEIISNTIKEWTRTLPLKQVHCPRELRSFIDDMSTVVTSLLLNPEHWTAQNDAKLHREISKFLRRFPLIYELSTESHIFRMAVDLSKTLKNITFFRNENSTMFNNVTVYGVSVGNKNTTADYNIKGIKESDINENLEAYTKQLVQQIGEWLDRLNLPESRQEGFKEVAINDLAADIVDRHKYLELNPNNTGTEEDELEHLKYQIFKWINKLVGEENHETIGHAQELMQRVNSIPVPMLVRPQDKAQAQSRPPSQQMNSSIEQRNIQNVNSPIRQAGTSEPGVSLKNSPTTQQAPSSRMTNSPFPQQATSHRLSGPYNLDNPISKPCCSQEIPPPPPTPEEGTKDAVYDKYVKIFREQCKALPIDESTPSNAMLADQARRAIYNGILKTFFNLKSDPIVENDYKFFELMLEEKLDDFLDVLPQTEEFNKMRHSWKVATIERAIEMLDELHKLSDKPCFRRTVKDKFNRQFALDNEIQYCFLLQQGFLSRMADAYILQTNYKEKDPVKANIYRNRLMMEVDRLANHMSKVHNAGFRFFDTSKLSRIAMQTLEHVPIPADDVLQEEVEQIHIADEIEKWYKELPTKPFKDESDGVFRKRMMEILAKKLNDMHKRLDDADPSKEYKMKHEMSHFLEKRAELQENEDKNINFMVDQLHFRLKNRWAQLEDPGHFEDFEKAKPFSSTLAYVDNADFLAPLMDAATSTGPEPAVHKTHGGHEYFIQPGQPMQNMGQVRTTHGGAPYSLQGSGHPGCPQKAIIHRMTPNVSRQVPDGTRMSQGRPNKGFVSQQAVGSPCCQSMQAPISPRVNLEGSQFGPKQVHITQQTQNRPNLSQQGTPMVRQSPQLIQSAAHATPKNARGACQIGSRREQNINQSLRQVGLVGLTGPQPQCVEKNVASQRTGSSGQQGPVLAPCHQVHSQGQPGEVSGIVGSRDPTPSQGVGTTAQAATGAPISSEEDILDGEFRVKCRCLEVYRQMRRSLDSDCDRCRPYRCLY